MNDTTNTPARRRKSKGLRNAIVAAVVVVAAGGGWYGWQVHKANKSKEGEYLTAQISRGNIEDLVTSTGKLQPRDYVDVGAQVSGQIEKIYVEVGDVVERGDRLAEIDATTAKAKVEGLEAQLLSAETNLKTQENNLEKSKRDYQLQENLYKADATTRESLLNAKTSLENAERQIVSSKASIQVQKSNLTIEQKNLGYTTIVAPQAGTVMSIKVKEGGTVNATQNVPIVMQIADLSTMTVQSEVSEADIAKLYKGMQVYFTTLGGGNRRWYGELKRKEPTAKEQNSVVLYNALFDVQNEGTSLMPSMTAQVFFVSAEANDVLMVPMAAIQQGQQIARELAQKEREKNGGKAGAAGGPPGAPGMGPPGAPGAAPGAAGAAAANTASAAAREGAPAAVAANTAPGVGSAPAADSQGAGNQANRPGGQGNRPNGQGMRTGQPGGGGSFGGQRPGGANGAPGGFNPQSMQNMTPEQREQLMTRMRAGGGGGFGGQRAGGANGRQGGFGGMGANAAAAAEGPRPAQKRNGQVMVKKADGSLEVRRIVYGVTNRVQAEVLDGLKEGEEVVIGRREEESAASRPATTNNNNNQNFQNNRGGNNFQGGGNFRPF